MPTLSITDDNGKPTVSVTIRNLDPSEATMAVLAALKPLKEIAPPRKRRSDAGKKKGSGAGLSRAADAMVADIERKL